MNCHPLINTPLQRGVAGRYGEPIPFLIFHARVENQKGDPDALITVGTRLKRVLTRGLQPGGMRDDG